MKRGTFADIVALTEALYRAESAKMQALVLEEQRLRADLKQIEDIRHAARDVPNDRLHGYREIGADLMWQSWIGRSKAQLHSDLARVLGRKGQVSGQLRRTFGKYQAACQVAQAAGQASARRQEARQSRFLGDIGLLRRRDGG